MLDAMTMAMRKGKIGSSDAPAICGVSPYATPYEVWARMTGKVPAFAGNRYTEAGHYMERSILDWYEDQVCRKVARDQGLVSADGIRVANLDALDLAGEQPTIIEAKTANLFGLRSETQWGDPEEGAEGVPHSVLVQVHHQFSVAQEQYPDIAAAEVVAFIGGRGFCRYMVELDASLMAAVCEAEQEFWDSCITPDIPPEGDISMAMAKLLQRTAKKSVAIDPVCVDVWQSLRQARLDREHEVSAAKELEDVAAAKVISALQDGEIGTLPDGRCVTFLQTTRKSYTVKETSYRTLRLKAVGKGE